MTVCVCLCVCPAHLWGRSGCSRTLEWHTAPSSEALSCRQQNAQSEPATYCKAQKRMCVIRVMCTVPTYVCAYMCYMYNLYLSHTVYRHVYIHANTHSIHTCTCTPTHPPRYVPTNTHKCTCTHMHTRTYTHLPVFKQAFSLSLVACDGARGSLPLDRVDSLVTCSRMLWYGEQQQVRLS